MKLRKNKFVKKFLITLVSIFCILPSFSLQVAYAQDKPPTTAGAPFTCKDLLTPKKTEGYIITILEEKIGNATDTQGNQNSENVLNCSRVNTLEKNKYAIKYDSKCEPDTEHNPPNVICQRVQVYYAKSGTELLYVYLSRIYKWAAGTIGIVSVLFLVWGGIEMSAAQGDSGKVEKAKGRIEQSLGGLVLLFLSALILYTINPNFFTIG